LQIQTLRFTSLCNNVLSFIAVVAPDWLPRVTSGEHNEALNNFEERFFRRWFIEAPSPVLLRALCGHLSTVEPISSNHVRRIVLPVSADLAAEMLMQRFASPGSLGIIQVLQEANERDERVADELLSLLASLPERAAGVSSAHALRTESYARRLSVEVIRFVKEQEEGLTAAKAASIAASVLSKVVRRGGVKHVAAALFGAAVTDAMASRNAVVVSILAAFPENAAMEQLTEYLVRHAASISAEVAPADVDAEVVESGSNVLQTLCPASLWFARADMRVVLGDKLLTQKTLPQTAISLLVRFLDALQLKNGSSGRSDPLAESAWRVATLWGQVTTIQRLPPRQQAYMSSVLCEACGTLGKTRIEGHQGLLPALLRGISERLGSPSPTARLQAMRVGRAMSQAIDATKSRLFDSENLELLPEERWEIETDVAETKTLRASDSQKCSLKRAKQRRDPSRGNHAAKGNIALRRVSNQGGYQENLEDSGPLTETDSDDDGHDNEAAGPANYEASLLSPASMSSSDDSEFERYDVEDSDDEDPERTNLQLRDLIHMLQRADSDWKGQLQAIRSAEVLIRAAPDELPLHAEPLARALLHTRVPAWADEETPAGSNEPMEERRFRSLVALAVAAPEPVGLALAAEVYSPSMDMQGRSRALQTLATAAGELAASGSFLKHLPGIDDDLASGDVATKDAPVSRPLGRVTWRSERSLAAQSRSAAVSSHHHKPRVNRFPSVALKWAAALLKDCDVRRHGVDLFNRDHFVLGRLLTTLGAFLEACQRAAEAVPLAAAVLELVKSPRVHDSPEPFVRRAALLATSHALMAVPPAAIADALLGLEDKRNGDRRGGAASAHATLLAERLQWVHTWVNTSKVSDTDANCRALAEGCEAMQGALSSEALASLANSPNAAVGASFDAALLHDPQILQPSLDVELPSIQSLKLGR
jgi:hypothetical protein